ncbi:hypothetical protein [Rhizobium sp. WYJ-E13]|uniref:hypothetical protein n=1 Tax=Rhizobium sp. WYJ-E13 TaxID=2849093 RepID=UPI001C1EBE8E|nr:hypothetical protein [Rhizobium sp. WYJ-E13]QWW72271.1 hypothetical protein KQ933_32325 [Rhizobium sp. WYJ-E13]
MKTQQRKFVVEIKSRRRQSKAVAQSIWGDTDFKALTRQVEDDKPDLFAFDDAREQIAQTIIAPLVDDGVVSRSSAAEDPAKEADVVQDDRVPGSTNAFEIEDIDQDGSKDHILQDCPEEFGGSADLSFRALADEIAQLELENAGLRSLWGVRLREENVRLRSMLSRYS